ncbi:hypothetical protein [Piscinibacter gummiphilus]|uniref:Uncharacterized protein n=1 Tax=Piscinibacter gummiphilus TaxID=946333 RepID=A0ABZ0CU48_9BURK|nr:hypothetical protein [Piscinibacter gummiphilus]WOB06480.1 hypothetical protein RXV79_16280 [Piscinibacter gummiphilus]
MRSLAEAVFSIQVIVTAALFVVPVALMVAEKFKSWRLMAAARESAADWFDETIDGRKDVL